MPVASWAALGKSLLQPLARRVCRPECLHCSRTCLNSADLGLVLDGSSSVGSGNFRTLLQFAANLSRAFSVAPSESRVGLVQYTYEPRLEFGLDAHRSRAAVLRALGSVGYWSGGTSTGAALRFALERLFPRPRAGRRQILVLVTDGRSYDDVRPPALEARRRGKRAPCAPRHRPTQARAPRSPAKRGQVWGDSGLGLSESWLGV